MKLNPVPMGRRAMMSAWVLTACVLALPSQGAHAQTQPANEKPAEARPDTGVYRTFYLTSVTEQHEANDIVTDLRNMLPKARLYYVSSQNAISMRGTDDEFQVAQKILSDIDRPRNAYRLTYSLTEKDGDRTVGTQKVSLIALDEGERSILKLGGRVPIVTGTTEAGSSARNSEVQYIDTGLSIEATVEGSSDALRLRTRVAQSSIADERAASGVPDPTFRQTVLENMAALVPGKPLVLGSLDIPGTSHHEEVSVVSELVR